MTSKKMTLAARLASLALVGACVFHMGHMSSELRKKYATQEARKDLAIRRIAARLGAGGSCRSHDGPLQIPAGIPVSYHRLIQENWLGKEMYMTLMNVARYRLDTGGPNQRVSMPQGMGETVTRSALSQFDVDLLPVGPTGTLPSAEFRSEQWTSKPLHYGRKVKIDAAQAFVSRADLAQEGVKRLFEWCARTHQRLYRGKLFAAYAAMSYGIVKRAQIATNTVVLVNSGAAFRYSYTTGVPVAVSAASPVAATIGADVVTVTGVSPLDANFPNGPAELTVLPLAAPCSAGAFIKPTIGRVTMVHGGSGIQSTEGLTGAQYATLAHINQMTATLQGKGVMPHQFSGLYHLHCDETFLQTLQRDTAWQTAFQGAGLIPQLSQGQAWIVPALGIALIVGNDSPSSSTRRGVLKSVGASGFSGSGGVGAPGSALSMQDIGIDTRNSGGSEIRWAIMTGDSVMIEDYIDYASAWESMGIRRLSGDGQADKFSTFSRGRDEYASIDVDNWRMNITPGFDDRGMETTFAMFNTFDVSMRQDIAAGDSTDAPFQRGVALAYNPSGSV